MIMRKKCVVFLLLVCTVCYLWIFKTCDVFAKENALNKFGVQVTNVSSGFTYTVNWWQKQESPAENEYYITLHYSAKGQLLVADIISSADVLLNGTKIKTETESLCGT